MTVVKPDVAAFRARPARTSTFEFEKVWGAGLYDRIVAVK